VHDTQEGQGYGNPGEKRGKVVEKEGPKRNRNRGKGKSDLLGGAFWVGPGTKQTGNVPNTGDRRRIRRGKISNGEEGNQSLSRKEEAGLTGKRLKRGTRGNIRSPN